jgi:NAD(P)-dependent dehydrogenase (short-subunit alcohol dehydrogenase family)
VQNGVEIEQLDVASGASIGAATETILSRTGNRLDAVVHNAGVATAGALEDVPEAELRRVMDTNFFGVLALTRALLPTFRKQGRGRIVIVTSEAAFMGQPTNSIYCASKWALEGWAESIAYELEPFGIDVVLVEPGPYRTEIWKSTPRIQPPTSPYRTWVLAASARRQLSSSLSVVGAYSPQTTSYVLRARPSRRNTAARCPTRPSVSGLVL